MEKERVKFLVLIIIVLSFFPLSYLYRRSITNDIKAHSQFTFGRIARFTTSLKSGNAWYYQFNFKHRLYENYRSTHVDYDVKIGDYFLVNFSSVRPDHSKILYKYKLNDGNVNLANNVWDTMPLSLVHSGFKR